MGALARFFGFEEKTTVSAPINVVMATAYQPFLNPQEITPWMAWQLYKNSSVLAKCIDYIADEVAGLMPIVRVGGQADEDNGVLKFLKRPGFNRTRQRFIKELTVQYLVSGTAYPVVYGNVGAPPVALDLVKSQWVTPIQGLDMWPSEYWYAEGTRAQTWLRDPRNLRDYRWIDDTGLSEIVPIYDMDGDRRGVGISKMNAVKYDVELRIKGIQHNASTLDNGARLSGLLSFKETLTPEQKADVAKQFREMASGAQNAGRMLVTAAGEFDFTALSQNMKDMDFKGLVEIVEDAIVARYAVPVTLFRTSAQTNNNYRQAWIMFYNMAVLPTFRVVYAGLSQIFSERLGEEIEIVHDELTNAILADQALDRALKLSNGRLVSRNEARDEIGMEPVLGGDTIYGMVGDVPQAEDYFTNHGINEPPADNGLPDFHEARPEHDPIEQERARGEVRNEISQQAQEQAAKEPASKPGQAAGKPGKQPAKEPAKKPGKGKADKAADVIVDFGKFLQRTAERKVAKSKRSA